MVQTTRDKVENISLGLTVYRNVNGDTGHFGVGWLTGVLPAVPDPDRGDQQRGGRPRRGRGQHGDAAPRGRVVDRLWI